MIVHQYEPAVPMHQGFAHDRAGWQQNHIFEEIGVAMNLRDLSVRIDI